MIGSSMAVDEQSMADARAMIEGTRCAGISQRSGTRPGDRERVRQRGKRASAKEACVAEAASAVITVTPRCRQRR